MTMFFDNQDDDQYIDIVRWVESNLDNTFYLMVGQQKCGEFETFCRAVLDCGKIPVIITNVGSMRSPLSLTIRNAMQLSSKVRVYEVSKMAMWTVLKAKASKFVEINGGIIWTQ